MGENGLPHTTFECEIAIVGGGCSGALTAAQLFRKGFQGRIVIIEVRPNLGRGLAYSTPFEQHLLNVPASHMSALPDEPAHFLKWLQARGWPGAAPDAFAPRRLYGEYIASVLQDAIGPENEERFFQIRGEVVNARMAGSKAVLHLSDESTVEAAMVVLALGNPASVPLESPWVQTMGEQWVESPWIGEALRVRFPGERILLVGAGLTAVDSVLALQSQPVPCKIFMTSRRGIFPQVHNLGRVAGAAPIFDDPHNIRLIFRQLRADIGRLRESDECWRTVIDALRPVSNELWRGLPLTEKKRFVRHLKTYWEVHRHRMAPQIRRTLDELISKRQVELLPGRIRATERTDGAIRLTIGTPGRERRLEVDRVINCSGIQEDYHRRPRRFIQALIVSGLATANNLGIGFRTGEFGELVDTEGRASSVFFTLGPPRRGDLFETTAVPEIRRQAEALARHLIGRSRPVGESGRPAVCLTTGPLA